MPNTLADLIAPVEVGQFFASVQGRTHRRFTGRPGRFADLLPWTALNAILRQHRLEFPRLRLARDAEVLPAETYTELVASKRGVMVPRLRVAQLTEQLRQGSTLVVDAVNELADPVGDLAAALEHDLREKVQVNLYAGWGVTHGFDVHWDDHDVFVLQLSGRKRWRVYGPTRPFPLHRDLELPPRPDTEPVEDLMLEDGDVLYVPRGHWHDVAAVGTASLHLTFGFNPATGIDLLTWLADRLRSDERFRQDLPRFAAAEERAAHAAALRAAVEQALADDDVLDRFLTDRDAQAPPRPRVGLPWVATPELLPDGDDAQVRLLTPRAVLQQGEQDGTVELLAAGQRLVFAAAAEPVLRLLLDGGPRAVKELCEAAPAVDRETVRALLAELTALALVAPG